MSRPRVSTVTTAEVEQTRVMRPSNPGAVSGYPGHPAHPHPLYGAQVFPSRGPQKPTNNLKYYPSLSGSETDVSTSTENLTQVIY